jgi:hypothetical protein
MRGGKQVKVGHRSVGHGKEKMNNDITIRITQEENGV